MKSAREETEKMKIEKGQEMQQETSKQDILDQKKLKTKAIQGFEEGLLTLIKPFDVKTMDIVELNNKTSKKGFIDMEKCHPGRKRNSAKTKKEKTDKVRPQVLPHVWNEKFNA